MVDKDDVTCTDATLPEDCKIPEKKTSSDEDYSYIGWIFLAVFIVLIILGIGCFGVFYITLTKRAWSFKQVVSKIPMSYFHVFIKFFSKNRKANLLK